CSERENLSGAPPGLKRKAPASAGTEARANHSIAADWQADLTEKRKAAQLRARLAAAADYGHEVCSRALSPCARDLAWWLCRIGNAFAETDDTSVERLQRELTRAEHLWRACMEIEHLESGEWGAVQ